MAFEIVAKGTHLIQPIPEDCISVKKNGITFGAKVAAFLFNEPGKDYAEVFLDYENKRVGIRSTTNSVTGFKVQSNGKRYYLSNSTVMKLVTSGRYKVTFDDDMAIAHVPEIVRSTAPIHNNPIHQ